MRMYLAPLMAVSALALGACAYGDLGYGYGNYGYGGYNSYGYGSPYYGSSYGYGSPYYGWYDNYYYPGSGSYVYDSYRRPRVWTSTQRTYWTSRQPAVTTSGTTRTRVVTQRQNWSGFNRGGAVQAQRQATRQNRSRSQ